MPSTLFTNRASRLSPRGTGGSGTSARSSSRDPPSRGFRCSAARSRAASAPPSPCALAPVRALLRRRSPQELRFARLGQSLRGGIRLHGRLEAPPERRAVGVGEADVHLEAAHVVLLPFLNLDRHRRVPPGDVARLLSSREVGRRRGRASVFRGEWRGEGGAFGERMDGRGQVERAPARDDRLGGVGALDDDLAGLEAPAVGLASDQEGVGDDVGPAVGRAGLLLDEVRFRDGARSSRRPTTTPRKRGSRLPKVCQKTSMKGPSRADSSRFDVSPNPFSSLQNRVL